MKVVFFGTPHFVLPVAEVLKNNFDLVGVVTTPDEKIGRKQVLTPPPAKVFAQTNSIPVFQPEQLNNETIEQLKQLNPDLFLVAAYGKIIPQQILDIPKFGSINIHPSLLPALRGPSPIQSVILNGNNKTGITIIKMDADVDHGPILFQKLVELNGKETFESLAIELFKSSAGLLPKTIEQYVRREIVPQEQDHASATFCDHINKEDGYFDSNNPPSPDKLECMIRAYYPWPTAWTRLRLGYGGQARDKIVKLLPGKRVQIEGGKSMPIKDFINGYPELKEEILKLVPE